jgi:hypothetical protein
MSKRKDYRKDLPELPGWLQEILPPLKKPQVLDVDQSTKQLTLTYDGETRAFNSLEEAHKASHATGHDLEIRDAVFDFLSKDDKKLRMLSYPTPDNKFVVAVMERTDKDRKARLQANYQDFLKRLENYKENPDIFYNAWHFVDSHPAFWFAYDFANHPWSWEQSGYMSRLSQSVSHREDNAPVGKHGSVCISLTAGGTVRTDEKNNPTYKNNYADWRLEVSGTTFEEAVINLAKRVAICFNDDGTDNPEADELLDGYKPEWVIELEERLDDLREDS